MASRASPQAQALASGHGLARCSASRWVGSWTASPTDAQTSFDPSLNVLRFGDRQTFRMILSPHFGGDRARLHLSNRFGTRPVTFNRVSPALRRSGASLVAGSLRRVQFAGRSAVTVPAGHDVVSDPVRLSFGPFDDLAVSIYVDHSSGIPTEHWSARQTSYLTAPGAGNKTTARRGASFSQQTTARYYVDGLDVRAPRRVGSVVALGDSLTDGYQGPPNLVPEDPGSIDRNQRYPDFLARRLLAHRRPLSVLNAGISGNPVLANGYYPYFGPSAISRLRADVLRQPGGNRRHHPGGAKRHRPDTWANGVGADRRLQANDRQDPRRRSAGPAGNHAADARRLDSKLRERGGKRPAAGGEQMDPRPEPIRRRHRLRPRGPRPRSPLPPRPPLRRR
jgi:hypothetical protein